MIRKGLRMEEYEIPEIEIILFDTTDVITTSDPTEGGIYGGDDEDTDWD